MSTPPIVSAAAWEAARLEMLGWPAGPIMRAKAAPSERRSHLAHLNARDNTLVWASRAPSGGHRPPEGADELRDALVRDRGDFDAIDRRELFTVLTAKSAGQGRPGQGSP
jgi:hypothetical protein